MNTKNNYIFVLISLILTLTFVPKAKAEGYNFDFEQDVNGNYLDPFVLDTYIPVSKIWSSRGVIITTKNTDKPVGLFQSSCSPQDGTSLTAKGISCEQQHYGSNGLATGEGRYFLKKNKQISYKTEPQGNILIIEENPGNGIPQDSPKGGTIRFDFDRTLLSSVVVNKMGIVDNAQGNIFVKYMNGEEYVKKINHKHRNQLEFYDIPKGDVEYIEVTFKGNGGITGVEFDELIAFALPNASAAIALSSFTAPTMIAGAGLTSYAALSGGGSQSNNNYAKVFEPYFGKNKENRENQELSPENNSILESEILTENNHEKDNKILESETLTKNNNKKDFAFSQSQNSENQSNPENLDPIIDSGFSTQSEESKESEESNEFEQKPVNVPEPSMMIGTLVALGLGKIFRKNVRKMER